jgi:hypothetical protein
MNLGTIPHKIQVFIGCGSPKIGDPQPIKTWISDSKENEE